MFKKIALAAAVAASASFATYNYFPVGEAGHGQAEVKAEYKWHDDWSQMQIGVGGEFVVIPKLELSIFNLGYQLWSEDDDCDECETDGLYAFTIGARYQFMPMLIAALDIQVPLSSDDITGKYDPFGLYAAIQYTQEFIPGLALGSELGFNWKFEDEDIEEGLQMTLQAELDYTIASIGLTPWVGLSFDMQLTETQVNGHDAGGDENQITFWFGAGYDINPMFTVKANFVISNGDLWGDSMAINGALDINF